MAQIDATYSRDGNGVPISSHGLLATKSITYVAGTTGATGATTLFTVTGTVIVRIFAVCTTLLDEAGATATIEVGISGNTASLIAQTNAVDIDANEIWLDGTPATVESIPTEKIIGNGQDIIQTIATQAISAGVLNYYCLWVPISSTGNLVAA